MEVIAKGNFIRISPKKARPVADLIRGKNAKLSSESLKLMPQRTAGEIKKVLDSAIANAENNFSLEKDALIISKIMIDGGPVLKRHQPRGKGSASQIKKRTSHITVVVSGEIKTSKKAETKAEPKKSTEVSAKSEKAVSAELESNRPEFVKKDNVKANANVKNTMFRRKTG